MTVVKQTFERRSFREPSWFMVILISGMLTGILMFTIWWYWSLPQPQRAMVTQKIQHLTDLFPGIGGMNRSKVILLMGVDLPPPGTRNANDPVRTDTMMLTRVDPYDKTINVVSIPRDSKVFLPGYGGVYKINAAYAFGNAELAIKTVEESFGVEVDNYLVANIDGVREFVDALGGINIYVEKPMRYRDRSAKLDINLRPGLQHLNGEEAEGYLRFRYDAYGDIGRIRRQQNFLSAVSKKLKDPKVLFKIKPLIDAKNEHIKTDLSTGELVQLAMFAKDLKPADVHTATIPGHPSTTSQISYWIIDREKSEQVLNQMIVGVRGSRNTTSDSPMTIGILFSPSHQDTIDSLMERLRSEGYDVVCKAPLTQSRTSLVSHNADGSSMDSATLRYLIPSLKDAQLIFSPHGGTFETNSCGQTDYTIVLGEDTRSTHQR